MGRFLGISAAVSGVLGVALIPLLPLSYRPKQDSFKPGVAIAPRFHVGVHNGAVCIYSDLAFGGGTTSISRGDGSVDPAPVRERNLEFPGGYYVAFCGPTVTAWSLNVSLLFLIVASAALPFIWLYRFRRRQPNKRAGGDGGIPRLSHFGRAWPAAPHHER